MGFEVGPLLDFIRSRAECRRVSLTSRQLGGGAIQENHALDVVIDDGPMRGSHAWVLRTDAPSGVAVSRSRAQEFALLGAAFKAGVTVPRPLWMCTDTTIAGRPFYIMERVPGTAEGRRVVQAELSPDQRRSLVAALGLELARIHGIDPAASALDFLKMPASPPALSRIAQYRAFLDELDDPQPVLEWGLRWLELNAPDSVETVLCHCDFRTGNIMIDGDRITGILDWEFADYSSPVEDLGWFCARCWRFGADRFEAGGIGEREDFVIAYEQESGRSIDRQELRYWQIMAEVRWAVIALQQAERHLSGRESSLELALTGYMVPEMEMNLVQAIERCR
jgi:aminoglycoside phosphotransferase (APT) family kinase protein